ncbi:MAG: DUF2914 domain-containing protein [Pseudomonadota bacterium]|nr:DUF2914 domain-containing protein [Pseudomonadota bacterium]
MRLCIVAGLLGPALALAETGVDACPTLVSAAFTTEVSDREPVSSLESVPVSVTELLFFTAIQDGNGEQLHHTWRYNHTPVLDVPLAVSADYWRTWSSKNVGSLGLIPGGQLTVHVHTESGCQLGSRSLTLTDDGLIAGH